MGRMLPENNGMMPTLTTDIDAVTAEQERGSSPNNGEFANLLRVSVGF